MNQMQKAICALTFIRIASLMMGQKNKSSDGIWLGGYLANDRFIGFQSWLKFILKISKEKEAFSQGRLY